MRKETIVAISLFLAVSSAGAQEARELLRPVSPAESQRLEEYNSVFLKKQLYFASRHRIVTVNAELLLQDREITVTPFDDLPPIELFPEAGTPQRDYQDEHVLWRGRYTRDAAPFGPGGPPAPSVGIASHSWDLEPSGNAVISSQNRFEFSPTWTFDEAGNPVLEKRAGDVAGSVTAGPPPQTAEQIERHKRLKTLNKHVFYSVDAVFAPLSGNRYVLLSLEHTPGYSVIYEIPSSTVIPLRIDSLPGDAELSPEEKAVGAKYQAFLESLPKEEAGKPIRGEVP